MWMASQAQHQAVFTPWDYAVHPTGGNHLTLDHTPLHHIVRLSHYINQLFMKEMSPVKEKAQYENEYGSNISHRDSTLWEQTFLHEGYRPKSVIYKLTFFYENHMWKQATYGNLHIEVIGSPRTDTHKWTNDCSIEIFSVPESEYEYHIWKCEWHIWKHKWHIWNQTMTKWCWETLVSLSCHQQNLAEGKWWVSFALDNLFLNYQQRVSQENKSSNGEVYHPLMNSRHRNKVFRSIKLWKIQLLLICLGR